MNTNDKRLSALLEAANRDARRYRKLKSWFEAKEWSLRDLLDMLRKDFDGAVDALPNEYQRLEAALIRRNTE